MSDINLETFNVEVRKAYREGHVHAIDLAIEICDKMDTVEAMRTFLEGVRVDVLSNDTSS